MSFNLESLDNSRLMRDNSILFLNYNTLFIQSFGFIYLMKNSGMSNLTLDNLDDSNLLNYIIDFLSDNTAEILEPDFDRDEYINFIKENFNAVTGESAVTGITSVIPIMAVKENNTKMIVASPSKFDGESLISLAKHIFFDIFNIEEIEKVIIQENINMLFVDSVQTVYELVFRFNINLDGMLFCISNLAYNYHYDGEILYMKYKEELDSIKREFNFEYSLITVNDLVDNIENES